MVVELLAKLAEATPLSLNVTTTNSQIEDKLVLIFYDGGFGFKWFIFVGLGGFFAIVIYSCFCLVWVD